MDNVIPLFPETDNRQESSEALQESITLLERVAQNQGISAKDRETFLIELGKQEFKGEILEVTYGFKYRLTKLLGIQNTSTWKQIIGILETQNPDNNWVQKKEA